MKRFLLIVGHKMYKSNAFELMTPGTTNYRVIPWNYESPNHSARQLITNPEATTALAPATNAASPNGWHNATTIINGSLIMIKFKLSLWDSNHNDTKFEYGNIWEKSEYGDIKV